MVTDNNDGKISENIKNARQKMKLSKAEVARRLSIPYTTYNNYETGFSEPKLELIKNLAEVLNVTVADLLGIDKDKVEDDNFFLGKDHFAAISAALHLQAPVDYVIGKTNIKNRSEFYLKQELEELTYSRIQEGISYYEDTTQKQVYEYIYTIIHFLSNHTDKGDFDRTGSEITDYDTARYDISHHDINRLAAVSTMTSLMDNAFKELSILLLGNADKWCGRPVSMIDKLKWTLEYKEALMSGLSKVFDETIQSIMYDDWWNEPLIGDSISDLILDTEFRRVLHEYANKRAETSSPEEEEI